MHIGLFVEEGMPLFHLVHGSESEGPPLAEHGSLLPWGTGILSQALPQHPLPGTTSPLHPTVNQFPPSSQVHPN